MNSILFSKLYDEQEVKGYIKQLEKNFRGSNTYKEWLCNHTIRLKCAATGLTYEEAEGTNILEVHHWGKTLYGISEEVLLYFLDKDLPVNDLYLTLLISEIHFLNMVDYVCLSHDIHKLLHKDYFSTIDKYPSIIDGIVIGNNKEKINDILDKYQNILIDLLKVK